MRAGGPSQGWVVGRRREGLADGRSAVGAAGGRRESAGPGEGADGPRISLPVARIHAVVKTPPAEHLTFVFYFMLVVPQREKKKNPKQKVGLEEQLLQPRRVESATFSASPARGGRSVGSVGRAVA